MEGPPEHVRKQESVDFLGGNHKKKKIYQALAEGQDRSGKGGVKREARQGYEELLCLAGRRFRGGRNVFCSCKKKGGLSTQPEKSDRTRHGMKDWQ